MRTVRTAGFTLIELLVVIAIIGILFGFTAVAVPRVLERAKIAQATQTANQIRTVLSTYYTDYGSYPARYGYLNRIDPNTGTAFYWLRPYLHQVGIYSVGDYADPFSTGIDTAGPFGSPNQNPVGPPFPIGLMEFFPVGVAGFGGQRDYPGNPVDTAQFLFRGADNSPAGQDAERQLGEDRRAFVYIPVYTLHAERVNAYYLRTPGGQPPNLDHAFARTFDVSDPRLEIFQNPSQFPPPRYDAFVLLSVGPGGETGGVLVDPLGNEPDELLYYITGLRSYFLATRDINSSGLKDFDFLARSRQNEAAAIEQRPDLGRDYALLPDAYERLVSGDPNPPMRYGPMIFSY